MVPAIALIALFGAMAWAVSDDPFQRIEFKVKVLRQARAKGIVVLPKPFRSFPVVIYLHGSSGSLLNDGIELRQLAEVGLAAVGLEYDQTNVANFDAQFQALNEFVRKQPWAISNSIAWFGNSLGAQRILSFALRHPEMQPQLLVRMSGGWIEELDQLSDKDPRPLDGRPQFSERKSLDGQPTGGGLGKPPVGGEGLRPLNTTNGITGIARSLSGPLPQERVNNASFINFPVLLIHGERDEIFPVQDARRLAELLRTNGVPVDLKVLPDRSHRLDPDRLAIVRGIGEYIRAHLTPIDPFLGVPQRSTLPFLLCMSPAFLAAVGCWAYRRRIAKRVEQASRLLSSKDGMPDSENPGQTGTPALLWWEKALRWIAVIMATLAIADTGYHLGTPQFAVSDTTLKLARKGLMPEKWKTEFELLAADSVWQGQPLKQLLDCAELAAYNRNELINWKVDEQLYRDYVLSPQIDDLSVKELNWRRPLWENFYPRIRKQNTTADAVQIVIRFLRERVTIAPHLDSPPAGLESAWYREITDARSFETLYVAALRSVGVPARLSPQATAEFWDGTVWQPAPRPAISTWQDFHGD